MAQKWADHLLVTGKFEHRKNGKFGENIWKMCRVPCLEDVPSLQGTRPVDDWYNEVQFYDYNNGQFSNKTGHFTQLVWVASQKLGLGVARGNGKTIVVANYDPPGNYPGQFQKNVLQPMN